VTTAASSLDADVILKENERLRREKEQWAIDKRILELKVEKLQRQLWAKKSERLVTGEDKQKLLFQDPTPQKPAETPAPQRWRGERKSQVPKGPKPLDPSLPREIIKVADPDLKELICPETKRPMQPGFIEQIEVLARRAPEFYVKVYQRWVFVSPAKVAPVYSPWPSGILSRSRVHASVVAYLAAAHYCEHLPLYAAPGIKRPMPGGGLCRAA
jgi:hypothetical protein